MNISFLTLSVSKRSISHVVKVYMSNLNKYYFQFPVLKAVSLHNSRNIQINIISRRIKEMILSENTILSLLRYLHENIELLVYSSKWISQKSSVSCHEILRGQFYLPTNIMRCLFGAIVTFMLFYNEIGKYNNNNISNTLQM